MVYMYTVPPSNLANLFFISFIKFSLSLFFVPLYRFAYLLTVIGVGARRVRTEL